MLMGARVKVLRIRGLSAGGPTTRAVALTLRGAPPLPGFLLKWMALTRIALEAPAGVLGLLIARLGPIVWYFW